MTRTLFKTPALLLLVFVLLATACTTTQQHHATAAALCLAGIAFEIAAIVTETPALFAPALFGWFGCAALDAYGPVGSGETISPAEVAPPEISAR